jgi:RNA polymerase-binding protein DksA
MANKVRENEQIEFRARLESKLRAAYQELEQLERRLKTKGDYGPGKGDPLIIRWEFTLARRKRLRVRIDEIEEAIERLDEGMYGICRSCGKPIDPGRLQALPRADLCIKCA